MLYDPKLSERQLVAFLETKDASESYEWLSEDCPLGQFFAACGERPMTEFPHYYEITLPQPHTFGAALERARQYLA
jgi:hypothetical protein